VEDGGLPRVDGDTQNGGREGHRGVTLASVSSPIVLNLDDGGYVAAKGEADTRIQ
jgi:hypothetical protein